MKNEKIFSIVLTALFTAIIIIMAETPLGYLPLGVINATLLHIPVILGALFLGQKKGAFLGFVFGLTSFLNNTLKAATASAFVFSPVLAYNVDGIAGVFKSIYICFIPRILVGIVPYYVYLLVRAITRGDNKVGKIVADIIAAVIILFSVRAILLKNSVANIPATLIGVAVAIVLFVVLFITLRAKSSQTISYAYAGIFGAFTNTFFVMSGIYILYKSAYAEATGVAGDAVLDVILSVITVNGVMEAGIAAILVAAVSTALTHLKPVYADRKEIAKVLEN